MSDRGALCLVLHSHMPYVEGFGTWPFGEEWLWEAVATVYRPLLGVLDGAAVTLGLTPVLCDQLEGLRGEAGDRMLAYLREVKPEVHARDAAALDADGQHAAAAEIRRAAGEYARAERELERFDLLDALGALAGVELMTSAATHPVLPLLATDAGRRLQLETGVASHERRFGRWRGALWLPECAYDPSLDPLLAAAGARTFCVEQTAAFGLGAPEHLEPVAAPGGAIAVPVDWQTVELVWGPGGYPSAPAYRDSHRRTSLDLTPWANSGEPYDREAAEAQAREHARGFVAHCLGRLDAHRAERARAGVLCCAFDTELLGHFWHEGPAWLGAVLGEAGAQGLPMATLSDGVERIDPVEREPAASSWGARGDLSTWDSPAVAELCFGARRAELRVAAAARRGPSPALERAVRELLAAQASDWAFMATRGTAGPYPLERARAHLAGVDAALDALPDSRAVLEPALRDLAPGLHLGPLVAP